MDVETFLTELYVMVDEYCKAHVPPRVAPGPAPSLCESEVMTLAIFSQWGWFASERQFYRYAAKQLRPLFPGLPVRSQLNRLIRKACASLIGFGLAVAQQLRRPDDCYEALDTMGCRVRNVNRRGRGWLAGICDRGYCNRLRLFEGFQVMTACTPQGLLTGFGLAPASTKEQPMAETFLAARACQHPRLPEVGQPSNCYYVADNGFCGRTRHARWQADYDATVITPPQRHQARHPWPKWLRRWHASLRQIVETTHTKLLCTFRLDRDRPHDLQGFRARLGATVSLHNFCIWLNHRLGRDWLAFADLVDF
ncbi:MAG: transposase [Caldilineaceae bacterium]|nr:transposase [Caldilineaceae bacterium]